MTKDGFNEAHVTGVEVNIASSSTVEIQMKAGASAQSVEVLATALLINANSPVVSVKVSNEIADNLPSRSAVRSRRSCWLLGSGATLNTTWGSRLRMR